ncbi:MAG: hypothetical protein JWQ74_3306 [Marmoricola sp.]|nr:hypothetical protein [Marmoricola sp.]
MTTSSDVELHSHDWIMAKVEEFKATGETEPRVARDPINQPMINNWLEAIGETDARFKDGIAPPAMAQVWTMYGLDPIRPANDPLHGTMQMFDEAGFHSVLGTNCDQTYARDVRVGETVSITTRLESVVGPKVTGVGEGYFVTTLNTWWVGEGADREPVATMLFRVLKFKPAKRQGSSGGAAVDKSQTIRPQRNQDTEYFWEGTAIGELRIQKCNACGELRHPPGPMCPTCHAHDRGHVVASGRGTVFSFLVHHAPKLPGKALPATLALIELEEGLRMIGEVQGGREHVAIGAPVQVVYEKIDDELTLAQWEVIQ